MMRQALECPHASKHLPSWIDLVFGAKQQGEAAVTALNVFYYCTYADAVDLKALPSDRAAAVLSQIQHFGQTPQQLWRERLHPRRVEAAARSPAPLGPLMTALSAGHTLRSSVEPGCPGLPVRSLIVNGDRCAALGSGSCVAARSGLFLCWGFTDGSLRACACRAPAAPPVQYWEQMHGGEAIVACCISPDGRTLATGEAAGVIAVWRSSTRSSTVQVGRLRGLLRGHTAPVSGLACTGAQQLLASAASDGLLLIWDSRLLLLLHALRFTPSPVGSGALPHMHAAEVVALCAKEETSEVFLLCTQQLQLYSPNGTLLALTNEAFPAATSLVLPRTPEWMVEQLPIAATGHADGSVRWWTVREPTGVARVLPRSVSTLPVPSHVLPAWELVEKREFRLQAGKAGASVTSMGIGNSDRASWVGGGFDKVLWTGDSHGAVQSWHSSASDGTAPPNLVY